jgi:phage head maturation protease
MTMFAPPGWSPASLQRRLFTTSPTSIDAESRSASAILSTGSSVARFYGLEILTISKDAIDTARVQAGLCSLLDSHQSTGINSVLGRVDETWIKGGCLWGRLAFGWTPQADLAWGMVQRNEISGISVGYRTTKWAVTDSDGQEIDQELAYSDGASFTYRAVRWELLEASLVSVGADAGAGIRSGSGADHIAGARMRMNARQAMSDRMSDYYRGQALLSDDFK